MVGHHEKAGLPREYNAINFSHESIASRSLQSCALVKLTSIPFIALRERIFRLFLPVCEFLPSFLLDDFSGSERRYCIHFLAFAMVSVKEEMLPVGSKTAADDCKNDVQGSFYRNIERYNYGGISQPKNFLKTKCASPDNEIL